MSNGQSVLTSKICSLLCELGPSTYDEITPKIEFWIEYALGEQFTTVGGLLDQVHSRIQLGSHSYISRFLGEFRNAHHSSEQAKDFVDGLCLHAIRWFAVASSEDLSPSWSGNYSSTGGFGFLRAASFVGHLIERGLIDHKLVRRHIFKPLTTHYYNPNDLKKQTIRAYAIYKLFTAAGNTLLQGLLEPEDVQDCFKMLDTQVSLGKIDGMRDLDSKKLSVRQTRTSATVFGVKS